VTEVGHLLAIQIAREAEGRMESLAEVRAIPGRGLEGDRYFAGHGSFSETPGGGREVTLVASEMIGILEREHGIQLSPTDTRRNLVTKGVSLNDLVGKVCQVGSVRMKGVSLAEPCAHLERLTQPGVLKGLVHRAGLRAELIDEGVLQVGDEVTSSPEPLAPTPSP
jgi:MOSC domain-containing protein YiiM